MTARPPTKELPEPMLRRELLAVGFDDRAIARQVKHGQWIRIRHGAYVDRAAYSALQQDAKHAVRARAVLKAAKVDAVLSHASALWEYDAPTWGVDLTDVHLTRLDKEAGRPEAGVRQHCGTVLPGDVEVRNDVPVTSATRLALDMITVVDVEVALVIVNHLLHENLTSMALLNDRALGMAHWPNSLRAHVVLRLADGRCESIGESRTLFLLWKQGLPAPQPQYKVRDRTGRVIARVDFAWPEYGVFLEFDGRVKYLRDADAEDEDDVVTKVLREKRREERVRELTGWTCIRITWADLEHPRRTAQRIRALLFPATDAA
ncbi:type IV toxin-antitoxin system AbiEi family antitoxin domain-containing protein [Nocardioides sp. KIGAM211]|uniref:Type IV toxin-antitoxin system AbiEi family antitoxin domain-containing protein n=1 Tax=Nocardioides luti TaxID=2761101 RepID=A0A7X0RIJ4_9ACTN|nr:type IV toxin-antitoxin system AbiEi family antitoxin domain-containing protein [Nocardioides luti]MBB6628927.1 type IV toxin-antitoxin system AbiEi family antitoxin domain-containing protein [Nocardioides luti]